MPISYANRTVLVAIAMAAMCAPAFAAGPKSLNYSMDYASVGASGGAGSTPRYNIVSKVTTKGFVGQPAASARYSVLPLVGTAAASTAHITDWTLY